MVLPVASSTNVFLKKALRSFANRVSHAASSVLPKAFAI
jgi:hypothetical protein